MTDSIILYRDNIKEFAPEICAIVYWFQLTGQCESYI